MKRYNFIIIFSFLLLLIVGASNCNNNKSNIKVLGLLYYHNTSRIEIVDGNFNRHDVKVFNSTNPPEFTDLNAKMEHSIIVYMSNIPLIKFTSMADDGTFFILEKNHAMNPSMKSSSMFYQLNWKDKSMFDISSRHGSNIIFTTTLVSFDGEVKHYHYSAVPVFLGLLGYSIYRHNPDGSCEFIAGKKIFLKDRSFYMPYHLIRIPKTENALVIFANSMYTIEPIEKALNLEPFNKSDLKKIQPVKRK